MTRGEFVSSNIDTLEYRESYRIVNTVVNNLRKIE